MSGSGKMKLSDIEKRIEDGDHLFYTRKIVNFTEVPANDPTYTQAGNIKYYTGDDGDLYTDDKGKLLTDRNNDGKVDIEDTVIPKLTLVHYEAVPAGCATDGSIEYWHDPDADKYFTDAEGANEITKDQTVVKAKGHRYANPVWHWSDDFTSATVDVTCRDCNDPVTLTATVTATVLVEPTYTTTGQTEFFAFASMGTQTFRYTKTVEVAKLALTHVKAVDSTCEAEGNTEYWYDAATGQYFSDAKGENEIALEDTVIAKKEHAFGEPEFVWSEDNTSAEAVFTCTGGGEQERVTAVVTSDVVPATYFADGRAYYTATVEFEGKTYTKIKSVELTKLTYVPPVISFVKGEGAVELSWTQVDGAEKYAVAGWINNRWQLIAQGSGTSYVLNNLKTGSNYRVCVVAKVDGEWIKDFSNEVTVTPKAASNPYPNFQTTVKDHKIGFKWEAVAGAEKYAIAVFQDNKWVVKKQLSGSVHTWTSPAVASSMYKVVVIAKVNGQWATAQAPNHAVMVTVK